MAQVAEFRRLSSSTFRENSAEQGGGDLDGNRLVEEDRLDPSWNRQHRYKKKIKNAVSLAIQRQQIVIRKLTSVRALGVMAEIFLVKMHYKK